MQVNHFHTLAINYIATAKSFFPENMLVTAGLSRLQSLLPLLAESIPFTILTEQEMALHTIKAICEDQSNECILMRNFLFSIFRLHSLSSQHLLERGILKQKILALLPYFEVAMSKGKILVSIYDKNADALAHFCDDTEEVKLLLTEIGSAYNDLPKNTCSYSPH